MMFRNVSTSTYDDQSFFPEFLEKALTVLWKEALLKTYAQCSHSLYSKQEKNLSSLFYILVVPISFYANQEVNPLCLVKILRDCTPEHDAGWETWL